MPNKPTRPHYSAICQLALAGYGAALLIATHLPPSTPFLPGENFDKLYHFTAYALLALLLATTWQVAAGALTYGHLCWTWIAVAVFGALDEITQIPVGRDGNIRDWTADIIGAAIGLFLFVGLRRLFVIRNAEHKN